MGSLRYASNFSAKQALQKYEDFLVADPASPCRPYAVYALLDGHHGDSVSHFLSCHLLPELAARLPDAPAPGHDRLDALHTYAELVRKAVTAAFLALSLRVQQLGLATGGGSDAGDGASSSGAGVGSCGSTATVAVQAGPLLTVANVGNSRAVLDVGHTSFELSVDHKLGNCEDEDERLDAAGARVARLKFDLSGPAGAGEVGCGPLRLWPGGLHMSRAIGDDGCSSAIIPHPSICQVVLPARASRLILATGGVWDAFETLQKVAGLLRDVSLTNAAPALLRRAQQRKQHRQVDGDASVLVVDFVPEACSGFKSQMRLDRLSRSSTGSQHSVSGGASGAASSLVRRLSNSKLTSLGSLAPAQQQQRLQQQVVLPQAPQPQSFYRHSYSGNASTPFSAAAAAATATAPVRDAAEQRDRPMAQLQQQQPPPQQQHARSGLLQQLKAALCMAVVPSHEASTTPAAAAAAGPPPCQLTPQSSCGLQQSSSFGSSTTADTLSSGATSTASSGGGSSWRSRSWRSSSWRSNNSGRRGSAKASPQLRQIQEDVTVSRILARIDAFQAYCGGRYGPIGPQLAALDAQLALAGAGVHGRAHGAGGEADAAAHTMRVRAVRSLNDLQLASQGAGGGGGGGVNRMPRRSPAAASTSPSSVCTTTSMPLSV